MTISKIKQALRNGKYAWPGGYPMYFVAKDGAALSFEAVRENWRQVVWAHVTKQRRDDWLIADVCINWEDEGLFCEHTNAHIECAYPHD